MSATAPQWQPLTPELLREIAEGQHGPEFWLYGRDWSRPKIGHYAWHSGWHPDGFETDSGERIIAKLITHVMPFIPPALPSV